MKHAPAAGAFVGSAAGAFLSGCLEIGAQGELCFFWFITFSHKINPTSYWTSPARAIIVVVEFVAEWVLTIMPILRNPIPDKEANR